ncbi:MAG: ribosomal protein S18-alanine N-acetyltransferase [Dehalococcoidia bacterium]|nr:ribosomal protein S18-alanine N-acetyltransferase [Dehalococcoidia bacterium]
MIRANAGGGLKPLVIDPMKEDDIPQVLDIEREAFSLAWSEGAYRRELRWNRLARYLVLRQNQGPEPQWGKTARSEERVGARFFSFWRRPQTQSLDSSFVVGYAGQWLMVDESHLITIAVIKEYRRRGLGESLLIAAIGQAVELGARIMTLEVRLSNYSAQAMYEKFGFRKVGIRHSYYTDNNEDAIIMASDVLSSAAFQARLQQLKRESRERTLEFGLVDR